MLIALSIILYNKLEKKSRENDVSKAFYSFIEKEKLTDPTFAVFLMLVIFIYLNIHIITIPRGNVKISLIACNLLMNSGWTRRWIKSI